MPINPYAPLRLCEIDAPGSEPSVHEDLFTLMAAIAAHDGAHTISIHNASDADKIVTTHGKFDTKYTADSYSLWIRQYDQWMYHLMGRVRLGELACEFMDLLLREAVDEIRICAPGCPQPTKFP